MHWAILIVCILVALVALMPIFLRLSLGVRPETAKTWRERVELRYQGLGTWTWMFARFKLRLDPMFRELPELMGKNPQFKEVIDLGCGHGIAGCALLEWFPEIRINGIEPSAGRVRIAAGAFGMRGVARKGAAPDFEWPGLSQRLDAAFVLDVMHYLDDAAFTLTLWRIRRRLREGGRLFIRIPMAPSGGGSFAWRLDRIVRRTRRIDATHRSIEKIKGLLSNAGFVVDNVQASGGNPELYWFVATANDAGQSAEKESPR